jgi:hypothetical protein
MLALLLSLAALAGPWTENTLTDPMDGTETRLFTQQVTSLDGRSAASVSGSCSTGRPDPMLMVMTPKQVIDTTYDLEHGRHVVVRIKVDDREPRTFHAMVNDTLDVVGLPEGQTWAYVRSATSRVLVEVPMHRAGRAVFPLDLDGIEAADDYLGGCKGE